MAGLGISYSKQRFWKNVVQQERKEKQGTIWFGCGQKYWKVVKKHFKR